MKIKIGIIGPQDSIRKILEFAKEFEESAELVPYAYKVKDSAIELTSLCQEHTDLVLYTGEAPYRIALQAGIIRKPALFLPRNGSCIYKALWEMRNDGVEIKNISTEGLLKEEVLETASELGIEDFGNVYTFDIFNNFNVDYVQIADYHTRLFKEGSVGAVITAFSKIYEMLKDHEIPVYKVFPTKSLIRENLHKALLLGKMKISKDAQVAVQIVKIRDPKGVSASEYDFMSRRNRLESMLIQYTRENLGSLFPMGRDEYLIFTNRGAIENADFQRRFDTRDFSKDTFNAILSSGIGFGNTVYEAENNARAALGHAAERDFHCAFIIDDNGTISGPYAKEEDLVLSYSLSSGKSEEIRKMADATTLSPVYIAKLRSLIEKNNKNVVDAPIVADYLNISVRSARRILTVLTQSGFAIVKYTESKAKTGRPCHVYELNLQRAP